MNSIDFCYWLQGYFEVADPNVIPESQLNIIKNHLNLVFKHEIDPLRESQTTTPAEELNHVHNGGHDNDTLYRC
jgi:hypothetical protein